MLAKVPLLICHQIMCCAKFASEVYLHCGCGLTWPFHLHSPVCQLFLSQSSKKQTCCMFWLTLRILILVFFFFFDAVPVKDKEIYNYIYIMIEGWSGLVERKSPPTVRSTASVKVQRKGSFFALCPLHERMNIVICDVRLPNESVLKSPQLTSF